MGTAYHSQVTTLRQTPLLAVHERLGATLTPFAGWQMPLRYGSETAEHLAVRRAAGLFDLSHMGEILVTGPAAGAALDFALTGYLSAVPPGRARYTMICAPDGGVLDDLVVYRQGEQEYLVVANAANTAVVLAALAERAVGFDAKVTDATGDYALIAIQGPEAARILAPLTGLELDSMKYYAGAFGQVAGRTCWVARTGYTGEDGFELFCAPDDAVPLWEALTAAGSGAGGPAADGAAGLVPAGPVPAGLVTAGLVPAGLVTAGLVPAGLAARDTLRLEAGMPLYGNELGPDITPFEAGLGRVVKFDKPGDFVGREALTGRAASGPVKRLAGLTIESRRVARHGYPVLTGGVADEPAGRQVGVVTSGAPSPTLGVPIALAYLGPEADPASRELAVGIRGQAVPAHLTDLPFYTRRH
jgi:aminomethyltransferase